MKQHEVSQIFCVNRGMAGLRNCWPLSGLWGELVYAGSSLLCLSCCLFLSHLWFLVHSPFFSSGCLSTSSLHTTSLLNLVSVFLQTSRFWPSTLSSSSFLIQAISLMCCCLYPCTFFYYLALPAPHSNIPFEPREQSLPPQASSWRPVPN